MLFVAMVSDASYVQESFSSVYGLCTYNSTISTITVILYNSLYLQYHNSTKNNHAYVHVGDSSLAQDVNYMTAFISATT